MKRSQLFQRLKQDILAIELDRPVLVGVDGRDAAGKTTLAAELAEALREEGRTVIEASIDGFHNPRTTRYRRGRDDPEGYYRDSFNIKDLKKHLLVPLKVGCLHYTTRVFDYRVDGETLHTKQKAPRDAVLVFDGVFVHRPELQQYWNYSVYLYVGEEESTRRGVLRDPGEAEEIRRRYRVRYLPGQRLYHEEAQPMRHASIIIDNTNPMEPTILGKPKEE